MNTENITWIQISDIHILLPLSEQKIRTTRRKINTTASINDRFIKKYLNLLRQEMESIPPDLLFICGDISQSGKSEEFLKFQADFLNHIKDIKIFVVAGNHDKTKNTPLPFTNFENFKLSVTKTKKDIYNFENIKITAYNSAIDCIKTKQDIDNLSLDQELLAQAGHEDSKINIAVLHHPPHTQTYLDYIKLNGNEIFRANWFKQETQLKNLYQNHDFILTGHEHEFDVVVEKEHVHISTGYSHDGDFSGEHPHSYTKVSVDIEQQLFFAKIRELMIIDGEYNFFTSAILVGQYGKADHDKTTRLFLPVHIYASPDILSDLDLLEKLDSSFSTKNKAYIIFHGNNEKNSIRSKYLGYDHKQSQADKTTTQKIYILCDKNYTEQWLEHLLLKIQTQYQKMDIVFYTDEMQRLKQDLETIKEKSSFNLDDMIKNPPLSLQALFEKN